MNRIDRALRYATLFIAFTIGIIQILEPFLPDSFLNVENFMSSTGFRGIFLICAGMFLYILIRLDEKVNRLTTELSEKITQIDLDGKLGALSADLTTKLERSAGGSRLDSWAEVYTSAMNLIGEAENEILATSFGNEGESSDDEYLNRIVNRMQTRRNMGKPALEYKVMFGYAGPLTQGRARDILKRFEKFHEFPDSLFIKAIETRYAFDILIVDGKHMIIAFPQKRNQSELHVGILFRDEAEFVSKVARWQHNQLWDNRHAYELERDHVEAVASGKTE